MVHRMGGRGRGEKKRGDDEKREYENEREKDRKTRDTKEPHLVPSPQLLVPF